MRLGFVILNEVKNPAHPTDKILRCAQDDKQGAGKDGFARRIGSTTRFSLVKVSGASNHALLERNRNRQSPPGFAAPLSRGGGKNKSSFSRKITQPEQAGASSLQCVDHRMITLAIFAGVLFVS